MFIDVNPLSDVAENVRFADAKCEGRPIAKVGTLVVCDTAALVFIRTSSSHATSNTGVLSEMAMAVKSLSELLADVVSKVDLLIPREVFRCGC